tara:strand:+ start:1526 stop:1735 length:210 start_codon:yes stop_codon:yes gene_type:complete
MTAKLTMLVGKYWNSMEALRKLKKNIPRKHEYLQRYLDVLGIYWNALWRRERDSNPRYLAVNTLSKRAP